MKLLKAEAGVNDGKAGLLSAAGLFAKGGIFDKKSESFNIHELDPYLLFDAQSSMLGTLEAETLDLDPATPSTLDVITATRAGTATYTDASGNIATAPANTVRVDHTQGEQLTPTKFQNIGYTDFSSGWSAGTNLVISAGDGLSGNISKTVTLNNPTNQSYYHTITTVENQVYTGGFWIRRLAGTGSIHLYHLFSATGTQTEITSEITSEWSFVSKEFLGRSGGGGILFGLRIYTQGDSVEIAMPQVEEGTTASSFVANTTGSPKFISSAVYSDRVPMILVEPSATNLLSYSEDFSDSSWTKSGSSVVSGFSSPDGLNNSFKLIEDSSNQKHFIKAESTSTAGDYSRTIHAKAGERDIIQITQNGVFSNCYANFNLTSGVITASAFCDAEMEALSDGWYRCTIKATFFTRGAPIDIFNISAQVDPLANRPDIYQGDGTSGVYIWGAQLEAGSVATSYIPTSGGDAAARTRAADDLVISGSAFTDFFNGSEGTFYIEAIDRDVSGGAHAYIVGQGTSQFFLYKNNAVASVNNYDGPLSLLEITGLVSNQLFRAAASYNSSVKSLSFNGTTVSGNARATGGFSDTNILKIGSGYTNVFSGHFRRIIYWPTHSDNL